MYPWFAPTCCFNEALHWPELLQLQAQVLSCCPPPFLSSWCLAPLPFPQVVRTSEEAAAAGSNLVGTVHIKLAPTPWSRSNRATFWVQSILSRLPAMWVNSCNYRAAHTWNATIITLSGTSAILLAAGISHHPLPLLHWRRLLLFTLCENAARDSFIDLLCSCSSHRERVVASVHLCHRRRISCSSYVDPREHHGYLSRKQQLLLISHALTVVLGIHVLSAYSGFLFGTPTSPGRCLLRAHPPLEVCQDT